MVIEKHKLLPGVLDHLDDAYFAVEEARVVGCVNWEQRKRDWEQGEPRSSKPKGKEDA